MTFQPDQTDAIWRAIEWLLREWHRSAHQTVRGSNERAIENNHFAASPGDSLREPTTHATAAQPGLGGEHATAATSIR